MPLRTVLCLLIALRFASSLNLPARLNSNNINGHDNNELDNLIGNLKRHPNPNGYEHMENFPLRHFKNRQPLLFKRFDYEDMENFPLRHFKNRQPLLFKRFDYEDMENFPLRHFKNRQPLLFKRKDIPSTYQNPKEMEDALQQENDDELLFDYIRPILVGKKYYKYDNINDDYLRYFRNRLWNV